MNANQGELTPDLIRGMTDTIVLGLLLEEDRYGYEIYKEILRRSDNTFELKEATLYASIRRLEQEGCLSSHWGEGSRGGRRRYYSVTVRGLDRYRRSLRNWTFAKQMLDRLLARTEKEAAL